MKTTRNPEGDDETEPLDKLCVHCVAGSQVCLGVGTQKESYTSVLLSCRLKCYR